MNRIDNINSEENLHYRLLELLPIKLLREFTDKNLTKKDAILKLLLDKSFDQIKADFIESMETYKQYVFLLKPERVINLNEVALSDLVGGSHQSVILPSSDQHQTGYFFPKVRRNFISVALQRNIDVDFYWPFKMVVRKNLLILSFVILERISSMLEDLELYERRSSRGKDLFQKRIIDVVKEQLNLVELDINKGIKYLWAKGVVDSPMLQSKSRKSTSQEVMDIGLYLKQDYNLMYQKIIQRPLLKAVFHVIKKEEKNLNEASHQFPKKFSSDPSFGRLYFNSYSKFGEIDNVIESILANN